MYDQTTGSLLIKSSIAYMLPLIETTHDYPRIRIIENFLTEQECDWFVKYITTQDLWSFCNAVRSFLPDGKDFDLVSRHWDDRKIDFNKLYTTKTHAELYRNIYPMMLRAKQEVARFFDMSAETFQLESWEAVRWYSPFWQGPHLDYIDRDFDRSNYKDIDLSFFSVDEENLYRRHCTTKHYTAMMYMNSDFEGGELNFPFHNNFQIKPRAGMLVIFSGNVFQPHGINQITSGTRYVHTTFWCRDTHLLSKHQEPVGFIGKDPNITKYW